MICVIVLSGVLSLLHREGDSEFHTCKVYRLAPRHSERETFSWHFVVVHDSHFFTVYLKEPYCCRLIDKSQMLVWTWSAGSGRYVWYSSLTASITHFGLHSMLTLQKRQSYITKYSCCTKSSSIPLSALRLSSPCYYSITVVVGCIEYSLSDRNQFSGFFLTLSSSISGSFLVECRRTKQINRWVLG